MTESTATIDRNDSDRLYWLVRKDLGIDQIGDIDLHERAYSHWLNRRGDESGETEPQKADYISAVRDAIDEVMDAAVIEENVRGP